MHKPLAASRRKSLQALDYVNVFLADVRDGVGPYLAIYLLATHHWNPASIGVAMSASGIAGLVAQTPMGLIVDATRKKRLLIAIASFFVAVGCITMVLIPKFSSVQILDGIAAGIFGVLWVLVVADLSRGTGRFNFLQGAIATATGIGASLSNLAAGLIVQAAGYDAAFLTLAAIAGVALLVFGLAMPETIAPKDRTRQTVSAN